MHFLLKVICGHVVTSWTFTVAHLNNSGPNFTFILITGIKCIFAVLAQLLYLSLIYVTIKTK